MNEQTPADLAEIAEEMRKARLLPPREKDGTAMAPGHPNYPKRLKERHPDDADPNQYYPWSDSGSD